MQITDPEFFYTHYVGHAPEQEYKWYWTRDMIEHYLDSGLRDKLPDIYEACAPDEVLSPANIPYHLWEKNNLITPDAFYMHPQLRLNNKAPQYDPTTNQTITYPFYWEVREYYSMDHLISYTYQMIQKNKSIDSFYSDKKMLYRFLDRYRNFRNKGIEPLDVVLFLILYHKGEKIDLVALTNNEDQIIDQVIQYQQKLKAKDLYRVTWRGSLNHAESTK